MVLFLNNESKKDPFICSEAPYVSCPGNCLQIGLKYATFLGDFDLKYAIPDRVLPGSAPFFAQVASKRV